MVMWGYQVSVIHFKMVTMTTAAVLITFALHMDKKLHPNTTLRIYYIITVTG